MAVITDELRKSMHTEIRDGVLHVTVNKAAFNVVCNGIDDAFIARETEIAELGHEVDWLTSELHGWEKDAMMLPLDADGIVIRIGDEMQTASSDIVSRVTEIRYTELRDDDQWRVYPSVVTDASAVPCRPEGFHHRQHTKRELVEKALYEASALDREGGYWASAADITNILNDLMTKIGLEDA